MTLWECSPQRSPLGDPGTKDPITSADKLQGSEDGERRGGTPVAEGGTHTARRWLMGEELKRRLRVVCGIRTLYFMILRKSLLLETRAEQFLDEVTCFLRFIDIISGRKTGWDLRDQGCLLIIFFKFVFTWRIIALHCCIGVSAVQ